MNNVLRYLCTFKFWKELVLMTLGMAIAAAGVYYFMMPSKLVLGSISGLSIVISNLFGLAGITVKVSVVVTVINAILLIMAWRRTYENRRPLQRALECPGPVLCMTVK